MLPYSTIKNRSGVLQFSMSVYTFYCVLGLFKLACVMEGSYARYTAGTSDDAMFAFLESGVPGLARRALEFT